MVTRKLVIWISSVWIESGWTEHCYPKRALPREPDEDSGGLVGHLLIIYIHHVLFILE